MITELLTTALLAVSLGSLKPDTPKGAISDANAVYGRYEFTFDIHGTDYYEHGWDNPFMTINHQQIGIGDGWVACDDNNSNFGYDIRGDLSGNQIALAFNMTWYSNDNAVRSSIVDAINYALGGSPYQSFSYNGPANTSVGVDVNWSRSVPLADASYTLSFTLSAPPVAHSVSFLLNHCTTATAYPVSVYQGQTFTATFTAMTGYAFKGDNVAEYFDYPQGALNPTYQVTDYIGDYGSYWRSVTITAVVWADCTLEVSPAPLDEGALQDAYDRGYADAKTTYENTNQFAWLKSIWTGMAAFFSIEILPNISLGFLAFAPLLVVAIIAIVRIVKHD